MIKSILAVLIMTSAIAFVQAKPDVAKFESQFNTIQEAAKIYREELISDILKNGWIEKEESNGQKCYCRNLGVVGGKYQLGHCVRFDDTGVDAETIVVLTHDDGTKAVIGKRFEFNQNRIDCRKLQHNGSAGTDFKEG